MGSKEATKVTSSSFSIASTFYFIRETGPPNKIKDDTSTNDKKILKFIIIKYLKNISEIWKIIKLHSLSIKYHNIMLY